MIWWGRDRDGIHNSGLLPWEEFLTCCMLSSAHIKVEFWCRVCGASQVDYQSRLKQLLLPLLVTKEIWKRDSLPHHITSMVVQVKSCMSSIRWGISREKLSFDHSYTYSSKMRTITTRRELSSHPILSSCFLPSNWSGTSVYI